MNIIKIGTLLLLLQTSLLPLNTIKASEIKFESFDKVLKEEATKQAGLFDVYSSNNKLYFAIPDSLLDREFLFGARIAEVSTTSKAYAGEVRKGAQLISFELHEDKLFWTAPKNEFQLDNPNSSLKEAHNRSSIDPVFQSFDIEAFDSIENKYLIDVTDFYAKEIPLITPFASSGKPGKLDKTTSYHIKSQVFTTNIEVQHNFNFTTKSTPFRCVVNRSLLLLPKEVMRHRYYDRRMNYFNGANRILSDDGKTVKNIKFISRFRVEPSPEDRERYFAGELVEPAKQIIVYIDNGLPDKWFPYVKAGIEEWNKAFEQINFKNVISAQPFPENDLDFNPDNLDNTCFRYVPNSTSNARGPRYTDPRSGEILRGDIIWYHNVIGKLQEWLFIQTSAADESVRNREIPTEKVGRMIRYAVAHEMGHVLGFQHNMRASYAYKVEDLRDPEFTTEFGTTPSIMDYARLNYVAQPGDGVTSFTPPKLGLFDYFAIKWGYQPIEVEDPKEEYRTLNNWILEKSEDERYRFTPQFAMGISGDPAAQTEAVGNDAVSASTYGVKNLRYINQHLVEWCTEEGKDFEYLNKRNKEVSKQYNRYLEHVISYLGGATQYLGVEGENTPLYTPVPKKKQQEAMKWVLNEIVSNEWLLNSEIESRVGALERDWIKINIGALDNLMNSFIFQRLQNHPNNYPVEEYFKNLDQLIWGIGTKSTELSRIEMIVQQSYVRNLIKLAHSAAAKGKSDRENSNTNWLEKEENDFQCSCSMHHSENLIRQTSEKINHVDHFVEMAALQQLILVEERIQKLAKKEKSAHLILLQQILKGSTE